MATYVNTGIWNPCARAYDLVGPIPIGQTQRAKIIKQGPQTRIDNLYEIQFPGTSVARYVDNPVPPLGIDRLEVSDRIDPDAAVQVLVSATLNSLGGITYVVQPYEE